MVNGLHIENIKHIIETALILKNELILMMLNNSYWYVTFRWIKKTRENPPFSLNWTSFWT